MDEMCGESVAQGHSSKPEWDLTARERTLLRALAAEPTMQAVAESVHLSERQCRRLAARIRDVLGVTTTRQAVAIAAQSGLLIEALETSRDCALGTDKTS